ncbi:hypothetical protein GCM10023189_51370 [Nibrella saemangeumensis]|uniref:MORN repeat variant n=1 Tax=Nibrella saemangeumensis TaxID=1084526 RepID=A0ABP8NHN6_9BACT
MKKALFLLLVIPALGFYTDDPANVLNGVYRQTKYRHGTMTGLKVRDDMTALKLFVNGHWVSVLYNHKDPAKTGSVGGGTYHLKNGKYLETTGFYSWNPTVVGQTIKYDYSLKNGVYYQRGMVRGTEKHHDYLSEEYAERIKAEKPLTATNLEGVWLHLYSEYSDHSMHMRDQPGTITLQYMMYPHFVSVTYGSKENEVLEYFGGTYEFDGQRLKQTIDFANGDFYEVGQILNYTITLHDNAFTQEQSRWRELFVSAEPHMMAMKK